MFAASMSMKDISLQFSCNIVVRFGVRVILASLNELGSIASLLFSLLKESL